MTGAGPQLEDINKKVKSALIEQSPLSIRLWDIGFFYIYIYNKWLRSKFKSKLCVENTALAQ